MSPYEVFKWNVLADTWEMPCTIWDPLAALGGSQDAVVGGLSRAERVEIATRLLRELFEDGLITFTRRGVALKDDEILELLRPSSWHGADLVHEIRFEATDAGLEAIRNPPAPLDQYWWFGRERSAEELERSRALPPLPTLDQTRVSWPGDRARPQGITRRGLRLPRRLGRWLFGRPTSLRFPTDCTDAGLLDELIEQAPDSELIVAARLLPGRRGTFEIEVDLAPGWDVARVRGDLRKLLPPTIELVGGPQSFTGSMGT